MTRLTRLSPAEREARNILVSEGYRVLPARRCFVSRYKPVNLIGMRGPYEMIYLRLKYIAGIPDDPAALADFCREEGESLRTLFPLETGFIRLHREIWVRPRSGGFCCFEIQPDGMMAVTHGGPQKIPG
ncbi:hypothetical protein [Methanoregula sp.]|uniref:hypothetical protein n=1 Tax=Methanoregula sp. TaxID=2052170 RepID=UPI0035688743